MAVLAILALCVVVFRLRRKLKKSVYKDVPHNKHSVPEYTSISGEKMANVTSNVHELEQTSRVELPAQPSKQRRIGPTELE